MLMIDPNLNGLGKLKIKKIAKKLAPSSVMAKVAPKALKVLPKPLQKTAAKVTAKVIAAQQKIETKAEKFREKRIETHKKRLKKTGKVVKKALPIIALVAAFIPVLAPFAAYIRAAAAISAAADKRKDLKEQQRINEEMEQQEQAAVSDLVGKGIPEDKAVQIVQLIKSGMPAEDALRSVMGPSPVIEVPEENSQASMPPAAPVPESEALTAHLEWLKSWRPQVYAQVAEKNPEVVAPPPAPTQTVAGIDWNTGEYDYFELRDGLSGLGEVESWVDAISNAGQKLLSNYLDRKALDIQLQRLKSSQPPAPTSAVEQAARQSVPGAAGGRMPGWLLPAGLAASAGLLLFLFLPRARR